MDILPEISTPTLLLQNFTPQILSISEAIVYELERNDNSIRTSARFICVIEKESIFTRLVDDDICDHMKLILITGVGYPCFATRRLLKVLSMIMPDVPILGLFDYNPGGFKVFQTYKLGSFHPESIRYGMYNPTHD